MKNNLDFRKQVEEAYDDCMEVNNVSVSLEQKEIDIDDLIEAMWSKGFDTEINYILQRENVL